MHSTQDLSAILILLSLLLSILWGVGALLFHRKLPISVVIGVSVFSLVLVLSALGYSIHEIAFDGFQARTWWRGWIWTRTEPGALTVGVLEDSLGLFLATLSLMIGALIIFVQGFKEQTEVEDSKNLILTVTISISGVALSWVSLTPWTALFGIGFVILAGYAGQAFFWSNSEASGAASRFLREKTWGLVLLSVGLCALEPNLNGTLFGALTINGEDWRVILSGALTLTGLSLFFQPMPLLSSLVTFRGKENFRFSLLGFVFPAVAASAMMLRLEPIFRSLGLFPVCGWIFLSLAALAGLTGLLQETWRESAMTWFSSLFLLFAASLAMSGPKIAILILIGNLTSVCAFSVAAQTLDLLRDSMAHSPKLLWSKIGLVISALAGLGFIGFASAGGWSHWAGDFSESLAQPIAIAFVVLITQLGIWKSVWILIQKKGVPTANAWAVAAPILISVFSLGLIWSGDLSGGVLRSYSDSPDRVMMPFIDLFFGKGDLTGSTSAGAAIFFSVFAVALIVSYFVCARTGDRWNRFHTNFPRISNFIASGYYTDELGRKLAWILSKTGTAVFEFLDVKVWAQAVPNAGVFVLKKVGHFVDRSNQSIVEVLNRALRASLTGPSKLLQMIQSGDVQWYLIFALGSMLAILVRFLRVSV